MPTTLLVLSTSPADRAAPQELASQEAARFFTPDLKVPPLTPKDPKPVPAAERVPHPPLEIPASPPVRIASLAALCRTHPFRDPCTAVHKLASNRKTKLPVPTQPPRPDTKLQPRPEGRFGFSLRHPGDRRKIAHSLAQARGFPPAPIPRITPTHYYYLDKIGFDSQNRAQPTPSYASGNLVVCRRPIR